MISPYSIPPFISSILILTAGIFVLRKNHSSLLNQKFFHLCLASFIWLFIYSINYTLSLWGNQQFIEKMFRVGYCGVCFIGTSMFAYAVTLANVKKLEKMIIAGNIISAFFCYLFLKTNLVFDGLNHYFWGYYPKAGPYHPIFLFYAVITLPGSLVVLAQGLKTQTDDISLRNQMKYMILGLGIFDLACIDFIANYGFSIYPIGYLPAAIFIFIIYYAIIKHNLMDIAIVINRSLVYSILITTITIIYLLLVLLIERISQNIFRYNSLIVSIPSAIIIAIIFVPIKDQIQKLVDRLFLKKTPLELANENQLLRQNAIDSEKMKTIATLASGVAHEIRNPLTALKTFVEYFPKKKNDPEFIAKFEKIAGSEICRIENILSELLTFAKPSPLTLVDTDIKKTFEHALNLTTNQLSKNNVKVKTDFADNLPHIKADANKLLQVFINLIINANDAMTKGGMLTINATYNEKIYISITDTGCGIESKDLAKIFDPFFSTKEKGTGLGLAIVKGIIEDHGGEIAVKSIQNKSTTFNIILPTAGVSN